MTRTLAFIQARMSSNRFPGKVLEPLDGMPMILFMARRAARAKLIDGVAVLTSSDPSDDLLADCIAEAGLTLFRGDLQDVLKRFVDAAHRLDAQEIVRLTGDCPLVDPGIVDAVIQARRAVGADYASNVDPPSYPDGLDVECCTLEALERADRVASSSPEREHVTLWMRQQASGLRRANVRALADLSHLRLTVDYPDDLDAVRRVVGHLSAQTEFDLFDVLRVLAAHGDIAALNSHARNEGLVKSMSESASTLPGANP